MKRVRGFPAHLHLGNYLGALPWILDAEKKQEFFYLHGGLHQAGAASRAFSCLLFAELASQWATMGLACSKKKAGMASPR